MKVVFAEQGCGVALEGEEKLLANIKAEEKNKFMAKMHSVILLSLTNEVLREVSTEMTAVRLWNKLESKFQKNP